MLLFLTCAQMMMHVIAHGVCMNINAFKEFALTVTRGGKSLATPGVEPVSALHWMLSQLSYSPTPTLETAWQ